MKSLPLVSIVMAVYNGEKTIQQSVGSLLAQTLVGLDIIVVNDASTDSTAEILNDLSSKYESLTVIHLNKNMGAYQARSYGLSLVSSPWIGFLDADDLAQPNMFEELYGLAIKYEPDVVICGSDQYDPSGQYLAPRVHFSKSQLIQSDIFQRFCKFEFGTGALWNKLYRVDVIKKWGTLKHDWRQDTNEDMLINLGVFYEAQNVFISNTNLHRYIVNTSSVTAVINHEKAFVYLIKAYLLALKQFNRINASKQVMDQVTDLYKLQASFNDYRLSDVLDHSNIDPEFKIQLKNAVEVYPEYLLTLMSVSGKETHSFQSSFIRLLRQLLNWWREKIYSFSKKFESLVS